MWNSVKAEEPLGRNALRILIIGLLGLICLPTAVDAQSLGFDRGALTEKDEIFDMIERCTPSQARDEQSGEDFRVSCQNPCIETKLNQWFVKDDGNREKFFGGTDVYMIERAAGLRVCRTGAPIVEQTACKGQFAPDILSKMQGQVCLTSMPCDVRFDIDAAGKAENAVAHCAPSRAQAEFEREALCLLQTMDYSAFRGRRNVVQPFEMVLGLNCPVS